MSRQTKKTRRRRINFIDHSSGHAIVDDLGELNELYIKRFIDLHTHIDVVDDDFYLDALAALSEQYEAELALKRAQARSETDEKFYLAERTADSLGIYEHRRKFKWRSSPTKQILDARAENAAQGILSELSEGIELHDDIDDFIRLLVEEFGPRRVDRFIRKNERYLTFILTKVDESERFDLLVNLFAAPKKRKKFIERNATYLKGLLSEFALQRAAPPEPAPPVVDVQTPGFELEAEEEDLNILYELEDEEFEEPSEEADPESESDELQEVYELEDEEFEDDDKGDIP